MPRSTLKSLVLIPALLVASACTSTDAPRYPIDWHDDPAAIRLVDSVDVSVLAAGDHTTVIDLLSGHASDGARSPKRVRVFRRVADREPITIDIDVEAITLRGDTTRNIRLQAGDVVVVTG